MAVNGATNGVAAQGQKVFFFDIDNCLYPKSFKIHEKMSELIDAYFRSHLSLPAKAATELHHRYYKDYGLAIEGLVRHHQVDPLEYNRQVDDALPLEEIFKPDAKLRKLLEDIDRSKVRLWLFTNAYKTHGERVVRLLGVKDQFEGMTFCDYGAPRLLCKPAPEMYAKAMREAGIKEVKDCYFVDDSALNVEGAKAYGWKTAHLVEPNSTAPEKPKADFQISNLEELRTVFAEVFRPA